MKDTLTVAFFIIGNLIGAGFFMMPFTMASIGFNMVWSWMIGFSIAVVFSIIFGKLSIVFPNSSVLSDYFEDIPLKKNVAILYWIGAIVGNVVLLIMVLTSLKLQGVNMLLMGFVVMLLLTLSNHFLSYESIAMIEIILSMLKFALLVFLPLFIYFFGGLSFSYPPSNSSILKITKLGTLSFWSFLGIETAGVFGEGKAAKNGVLLGVFACFFLYVFSCFLIMGCVPFEILSSGQDIPLVYLIEGSNFSFLAQYVSYLISFTCLGALYGWVAAASKTSLSYAKSGVFPELFLTKTKGETSLVGLWSSSIITFILLIAIYCLQANNQFEVIADFCVNITLLIFALCAWILFQKTNSFFDKFLSVFGGLLIILLCSMNVLNSCISCTLFLINFILIRYKH